MEDECVEKCRICTISSDCFSYFNIFEKIIFKNVLVYDALVLITNLQIQADDGFPNTICCRCEQRLLDAYHFRRLAESSAKQFGLLQKHFSPAKEPDAADKCDGVSLEAVSLARTHELHTDANLLGKEQPTRGHGLSEDDIEQLNCVTVASLPSQTMKRKSMILQRLPSKIVKVDEPIQKQKADTSTTIRRKASVTPRNKSTRGKTAPPVTAEDTITQSLIQKISTSNGAAKANVKATSPTAKTDPEYAKRKYECQVCQKRFVGKSNLVDHLRFHANVKPFKCDQCDKSFVQTGSLRCHMRTHTNEKPYVCAVCEKGFSQSSSLKIHIRTHTLERKYPCEVCEKRFISNSDLVKHRGIHETVKRFKCELCDNRFAQNVNLRKHMKRHHPAIDGNDDSKKTNREKSAKVHS